MLFNQKKKCQVNKLVDYTEQTYKRQLVQIQIRKILTNKYYMQKVKYKLALRDSNKEQFVRYKYWQYK